MTDSPYLTIPEVALELQMTPDGVRKLIQRHKLAAVKVSERKTLVSRAALAAYRAELNGTAPSPTEHRVSPTEQVTEFIGQTGMTPRDWIAAFKRDEFDDNSETMQLLVRAASLVEVDVPEPATAARW